MTAVGGEKRPLEDILDRLNDLSRTPREIDLREPPPLPVRAAGEVAVETFVPSEVESAPAPAAVVPIVEPASPAGTSAQAPKPAPAPTGPPPVPSVDSPVATPMIDLTAPVEVAPAPPEPAVAEVLLAPEPAADPTSAPVSEPVSAVLNRESARLARTAPVEAVGRYGRNGAVVPQAARSAAAPANVPLLPVSVKNELEALPADESRSGPNWIRLAILVLLTIALVAALLLFLL